MQSATPLPLAENEAASLDELLSPIDNGRFQSVIDRLHSSFKISVAICPVPLPAPGLIITPEIRTQCERYLPIAGITAAFNLLYSAALTYPPILSSTPFHRSMSWADTFAALPAPFQSSANPARLLESLLADKDLLTRFLFASFLPDRFYGGIWRYPGQQGFIRQWLTSRKGMALRCLDTACGTGEDTYALALQLIEGGFPPDAVHIDGWTLEPLEVWSATHRRFPYDRNREGLLKAATSNLVKQGYGARINFRCRDIVRLSSPEKADNRRGYDLILCNGLLGGPIIHGIGQLDRVVGNLSQLLAPGGILLAADSFHGGWKQKYPQAGLRASFEASLLKTFEAGEGIGGLKSD